MLHLLGDRARRQPSGYAVDALWPTVHDLPEDMEIDIHRQAITWTKDGQPQHLKLLPGRIYIHPSGYKVRMEKHPGAPSWRLVGTVAEVQLNNQYQRGIDWQRLRSGTVAPGVPSFGQGSSGLP